MTPEPFNLTAGEIGEALGMKRQTVAWHLRSINANAVKVVNGNEAQAWRFETLPGKIQKQLAAVAESKGFRNVESMLQPGADPNPQWKPAISLAEMSASDIEHAQKLRDALAPWFAREHDNSMPRGELETRCREEYARLFGSGVSGRYIRKLIQRTMARDGGRNKLDLLELYTSERPAQKSAPAVALHEDGDLLGIAAVLRESKNPAKFTRVERDAIWQGAYDHYKELLNAGETQKRAARTVRELLWSQAPQLTQNSRDAMLKGFNRAIAEIEAQGRRVDGNKTNGNRFAPPESDVLLLRDSAVHKNGNRFDTAWREEYHRLSEYTRKRYKLSWTMPDAMVRLVNRELTEAIHALNQGKPALNIVMGGIRRKNDLSSMHRWVMDDLTSTIEVFHNGSLILPQIIAVMDTPSRYFTGYAVAPIKAPTAELVCAAAVDAFEKHDIPNHLHLENGFVFGRSHNVNGKVDDEGNSIVAGLRSYGCMVRHFTKRQPTAKGELEKAFDLLQRQFERHPGYTGRIQMFDASDEFKREQRSIRSAIRTGGAKNDEAIKRYTYDEFVSVVLPAIFSEYNSTPRQCLNGLSPAQEFDRRKDWEKHPWIKLPPELWWLLQSERYIVRVKAGGVKFKHFGRVIQVRGGELVRFIGKQLRAAVSRRDQSMVTFMTMDYSQRFTMAVGKEVSSDESAMEPGSGILAAERRSIGEHVEAIRNERDLLVNTFGNHRAQLLDEVRQEHKVFVNPQLAAAGAEMQQQRAAIQAQREADAKERRRTTRIAISAGVDPDAIADPDKLKRITEILKADD